MIRRAVAGLLLLAAPASAHDFWIAPERYSAPGKAADIKASFRIGTAAEIEDWDTKPEKIVAIRSVGPNGLMDQRAKMTNGRPGSVLAHLEGGGTHIITLESTPSEIELPATEFNDYLNHEGLTLIREWRAKNGQSDKPGRELYARRAKALVQLGGRPTDNVTRPIGLSLEIVPERNPLALKPGEALPVRLYFRGAPLAGARLELESLSGVIGTNAVLTTDTEGRTRFTLPRKGSWKIATVWSVPIQGNPRADFDTLFASLTFGY